MIRFGLLDFDTSHAVEFTRRLNHVGVAEDQWVKGGQVVIGCPGESKLSPERIPGFTDTMKSYKVPLVEKPEDMIGKVDVMLIEAVDGSVHFDRAKPFLEAGIPCFIDKPFTCSVADAKKIIELAQKKKLLIFSSSSLRFAPELTESLAGLKPTDIYGAVVHGPASQHDRNPGLFHYGIHAVEMLYTIMGTGCMRVVTTTDKNCDLVTGHWKDGRIGTVRGIRAGSSSFGALLFQSKANQYVPVKTTYIYRELLKQIVQTFETGKPPIPIEETLEIVAFIEAANKSGNNHGMQTEVVI